MTKLIKSKMFNDIISKLDRLNVIYETKKESLASISERIYTAKPHDECWESCGVTKDSGC